MNNFTYMQLTVLYLQKKNKTLYIYNNIEKFIAHKMSI